MALLGLETLVLSITLDNVGYLACNQSIGCTAKGHLVREIDALGGEMGIAADKTLTQLRMLNRSKGAYAYTMLDLDEKASDEIVAKLQQAEGVMRVRVIR